MNSFLAIHFEVPFRIGLLVSLFFIGTMEVFAHPEADTLSHTELTDNRRGLQASNEEILLRYQQLLNDDMVAHRAYLESYYSMLLSLLAAGGLVFGGLLTFFGIRYSRDIKGQVEQLYKEHTEKIIQTFIETKTREVSRRMDDLEKDLRHQLKVNLDQEEFIRGLEADIAGKSELTDNYRVIKSVTSLEYDDSRGSVLVYRKEQELMGISEASPVMFARETIHLQPSGTIEVIYTSPNADVTNTANKCMIVFRFDPPLQPGQDSCTNSIHCRLKNSFGVEKEWWEIAQLYRCNQETFVLSLPETATSAKVWVEESAVGVNSAYRRIAVKHETTKRPTSIEHRVELPATENPMRYRVYWEF